MPWTWLSSANAASPTCAATTAAGAYAAITQPVWLNQAATGGGSALAWHGLGNQSVTSAANTVYSTATTSAGTYWVDANNTVIWEDCVDQAQYLALARRRVERTEEERLEQVRQLEERRRIVEEQVAQRRALYEQTEVERRAALARSRELLLSHLTPRQRRTFEENHWFIVKGGATKTRYRIRTTGYTHNIEVLRGHDEKVTHRLCGHLRDALPLHDHHVAQKISLQYDEEAFVRLCNRSAA